jgi:hypothetical protein
MDKFIGRYGIITAPDTSINDPESLVEVSLDGWAPIGCPSCLRLLAD